MSSSIKVNMRTCSKTTKVTAELQPDGDTIRIRIASDCPHVREYAEKLGGEIHLSDVADIRGSRVVDPDVRIPLSVPCLVPVAVLDAGWMEVGMLSKHLAQNIARSNDIEFIKDDERSRSATSAGR